MTDLDFPLEGKRVFVAGHRGMVGSAILRVLQQRRCEVLTAPRPGVDLRRQEEVESWMQSQAPDAVFLAAARVGGIRANDTRPAEFIYDNLAIESAVIESARRAGVRKLLFLGSSCIYPRMASQPIAEEALLTGPLEPTNEWYAVAKIAGIKLCQAYRRQYGCNYISLMPTNLYGPGDSFDLEGGHVIPALMRKMHEGRMSGSEEVVVWGSGDTEARVSACRRPGGGGCPPDGGLRRRGTRERRHRPRHHHRRACADDQGSDRVSRAADIRPLEARWNASQAPGRDSHDRSLVGGHGSSCPRVWRIPTAGFSTPRTCQSVRVLTWADHDRVASIESVQAGRRNHAEPYGTPPRRRRPAAQDNATAAQRGERPALRLPVRPARQRQDGALALDGRRSEARPRRHTRYPDPPDPERHEVPAGPDKGAS